MVRKQKKHDVTAIQRLGPAFLNKVGAQLTMGLFYGRHTIRSEAQDMRENFGQGMAWDFLDRCGGDFGAGRQAHDAEQLCRVCIRDSDE